MNKPKRFCQICREELTEKQIDICDDFEYHEWLQDPYSMNASEIALILGQTRQNISQLLKRALDRFYLSVSKRQRDMTPFEIAILLLKMFNISSEDTNPSEIENFFKLFSGNIRRKIEEDAARKFNIIM